MQNKIIRKGLVLLIIILFIGTSIVPVIAIIRDNEIKIYPKKVENSNTDWWPMFHHDLVHSGYSTSTAPDTNNIIWSYKTQSLVFSSPAVADGKVYIGSGDNKVYCLDAYTGSFIWSFTTGDFVYSSPAVADGKVYIGSYDGKVYCLDAASGSKIWDYTTGYPVVSSPAVADGKVYIGSGDGKVYCLDAYTGSFIWNYKTGDNVDSSPAVADGKVYVGSLDGKVYCLDAYTGGFIWSFTIGDFVYSSPAVADGKVYIGSRDYKVYCLDAYDGDFIWSYTTGDIVDYSSPAVADGKVYIGSGDDSVYCLDAYTGGFIWSYTIGAGILSSPAVAGGKVYIGSYDCKVYCFGENENQPPNTPTISGQTEGKPNIAYDFIFNALDPDVDDVRFIISWGDGDNETTSFVSSGNNITISHIWATKGTYTISVKAEDEYGLLSPETTLEVTIPRNKALLNTQLILLWLLEKFPMIRNLLGL
jgi:outer membrane protein assembly factor BamB